MRMRLLMLCCLFLSGCRLFGENSRVALQDNWARWRALGIRDYGYHYQISCYCGVPDTDPVFIEVRGGIITQVTDERTAQALAPATYGSWPTIDSVYVRTFRNLDNGYRVSVAYDATYPYPVRVVGDRPDVVDDEYTITASGFVTR